jgi:hypothetical protein
LTDNISVKDSAGRMVIDHGLNIGGRYSLTTSTLVAGEGNSLLFVRNDTTAEGSTPLVT